MRRRECLGLLAGTGLAGCLTGNEESGSEPESQSGTPESNSPTPTPTEPYQTTPATDQETTEETCIAPEYLTYGEWYNPPDFSFTVLEILGQTDVSVSPSGGVDGPTSLPEERQLISVRVGVRNATNAEKSLCGLCNGFALTSSHG